MIFAQSRELARLRASTNQRFPVFSGPEFFAEVYAWIESEPLSALYSIAYTLSVEKLRGNFDDRDVYESRFGVTNSSESERRQLSDDLYTVHWSPFTLLHNMLKTIALTSESASDSSSIFEVSDLRAVDFKRQEMRSQPPESASPSDLFEQTVTACPIGAYDGEGVYRKSHELDADRYRIYSHLVESSELLRRKIECRLRETYSGHDIRLRLVMTASSPNENDVYYWQGQKSALLWILLHSLAAADTFTDSKYAHDFLSVLANLDFFIECASCSQNWQRFERPKWLSYIGRDQSTADVKANPYRMTDSASKRAKIFTPNFEVELARIHNSINARENKNTELSAVAVENLLRDYRRLIVSIANRSFEAGGDDNVVSTNEELWRGNVGREIIIGDVYAEKNLFVQMQRNSILFG